MLRRFAVALLVALIATSSAFAAHYRPGKTPRFFAPLTITTATGVAYSVADVNAAYDVSPLLDSGIHAAGQTIALVEFDYFTTGDLHAFDVANHLPDPSIKSFYYGGTPFSVPRGAQSTMDVEWAHAMAPAAAIQVYYLKNAPITRRTWKALGQTVTQAVKNGAGTISMSFGACGPTNGYTAASKALASAMQRGVAVFVSSGDSGALPGPVKECGPSAGVAYPASDPSVVAVGGTSLLLPGSTGGAIERAWRLSGGGNGAPLPRPAWQIAPALSPGKYRYAPDVAFIADPRTGVAVYYKGKWQTVGGTSLGAPAWAGIWALVRQSAQRAGRSLGAVPALFYRIGSSAAYSQVFHDITTGTNGRYQAGPGWDPVTGWGTPNVAALAAAVTGQSPAP